MAVAKGKGADSNAAGVWLITPDRQLRADFTDSLKEVDSLRLQGVYGRWQCAIPALNSINGEQVKVVVIDEQPDLRDSIGCLSFINDLGSGFSTIVLMDEAADENLVAALANGVSGFIIRPAAVDEIRAAVEAVAHGTVWMKRPVLERIASLIPHVMVEKASLLTNREQEIVSLAIEGCSTKIIADKLNISYYTVDTHIKNIYQKLKVNNRSSLVSLVLQHRW